ncbi:3-hydroxyacyl-CoA dehydrogenase NAD-binding domain-containing protein [Pseudodonghicola flavimaris]|uniref:3-hydroxyacyl-CoA dehydrogenase NAD-binding domain-containing protein n=1 Tax=Pseudodonghicola flavimaris TaxID=3050036 RepID=A0ABT7EY76_9RHOB|nr:3-hydroxyacyl-CoA dehydrogenase NAD-binding domain-containing protein [Pseudodonghicola flavimaris]MDK3017304.1 3-hydroxyacyl-CoA dehydrogenase NAD-binding domain-containing protein [Pseudodonghicola flavimaris]
MNFPDTAILGAGTIGMSWAALFAATGRRVAVYDPAPDAEAKVLHFVETAAQTLSALGWAQAGDTSGLRFTRDPADAVTGAGFVQESVPERLEIKHDLYRAIEPALAADAIIGSSTSGLKLSLMQDGFADPGRLVLAHPFNPPHLIPLVELMGNGRTAAGVLDRAQGFYESIGKVCVRLNKEVPGHIANRLQAAIWREAINLAVEGVASVGDIDKAVTYGPGLRWAAMGPSCLFHLGGGAGGIRHFCDHIGPAMQSWWDDLGHPELTPEVVDTLAAGIAAETDGQSMEALAARRDALVLGYIRQLTAGD